MRRALGGAAAAAAALALAAPAGAMTMDDPAAGPRVAIAFDAFAPPQVSILAGDTVTWSDDSVRAHTVTAQDGGWDSGRLVAGETFAHRFDAAGAFPYYCQIHPGMRGEVDAYAALLDPLPAAPAAPGRAFPLRGRADAPAGSTVAIEADTGDGAGFRPAGTAQVGEGGTFAAEVVPATTTSYRAVAGGQASPPVLLRVLDRSVAIAVSGGRRRVVVQATVTPAAPGATVVLQLRLRERFGWWPVRTLRLDRASRARFVLPAAARGRPPVPARVLLTLPDGATELARSATVVTASRP